MGRCAGFFVRQRAKKSRKSALHSLSCCSLGGGRYGIRKITCALQYTHTYKHTYKVRSDKHKAPASARHGEEEDRIRTRIGCTSESGGRPSAISMAVMPSDHTSAFVSYLVS